jgi:hypothetical protein
MAVGAGDLAHLVEDAGATVPATVCVGDAAGHEDDQHRLALDAQVVGAVKITPAERERQFPHRLGRVIQRPDFRVGGVGVAQWMQNSMSPAKRLLSKPSSSAWLRYSCPWFQYQSMAKNECHARAPTGCASPKLRAAPRRNNPAGREVGEFAASRVRALPHTIMHGK